MFCLISTQESDMAVSKINQTYNIIIFKTIKCPKIKEIKMHTVTKLLLKH